MSRLPFAKRWTPAVQEAAKPMGEHFRSCVQCVRWDMGERKTPCSTGQRLLNAFNEVNK